MTPEGSSKRINSEINSLIALYLNDELEGEEKAYVEKWCAENPEEYELLRRLYNEDPAPITVDIDAAWGKVDQRMMFSPSRSRGYNRFLIWSVAASVAVIMGIYFLWPSGKYGGEQLSNARQEMYEANEATLVRMLPDGTRVTLLKHSRLAYRTGSNGERMAALDGVAFFEVKHDDRRVFSVKTKQQEVTVLGTRFVINARKDSSSEEVFVSSGKVSVWQANGERKVILTQGEKSVLDKEGLHKANNPDANEYAWATKELVFRNQPIDEVFKVLEETFGKTIAVEGCRKNSCPVTASFRQKNVDDILNELSVIVGFNIKKSNNGYLITDIRCP